MAKNKAVKKYNELIDIDFNEERELPGDEAIAGMMTGMIEASNNQQMMAIELTKLVVQKSSDNMSEEDIFSTFKRATKMIITHAPLKELWEKFS